MSDQENKSSNSWFKAATICVAFACVAGPALAADKQPAAAATTASAAVDAKAEHRKLLAYQLDLQIALGAGAGASQETLKKVRAEEEAKFDARATGKSADMKRDAAVNRKLKKNLDGLLDALRVSPA